MLCIKTRNHFLGKWNLVAGELHRPRQFGQIRRKVTFEARNIIKQQLYGKPSLRAEDLAVRPDNLIPQDMVAATGTSIA